MKTNTTNTTFLPGWDWTNTESQPPELPQLPGEWWVRSSAQQERSTTTGEPIGFRHQLMRGKRVVSSGIGADAARKFAAQAAFLNRIGGNAAPRHELETAPERTSLPNAHATMAGPDCSSRKEVRTKIT